MKKEEFLSALEKGLAGLSAEDISERVSFYREMIDERIEEGVPEEVAVAEIGSVDSVVGQIMSEIPLSRLVKDKVRPTKRFSALKIILLVLSSPVWLPLVIVALTVILSLYVAWWAVILALCIVDIALAAAAVAGLVGSFFMFADMQKGLFMIAAAFLSAGLSIFMFFACKWIIIGTIKLTGKAFTSVKRSFVGN